MNSGLWDFNWMLINTFVAIVLSILSIIGLVILGNCVTFLVTQFRLWRLVIENKAENIVAANAIPMPPSSMESEIVEQQRLDNEYQDNTEYEVTRDGYLRSQ